jgi:hypothetical protein
MNLPKKLWSTCMDLVWFLQSKACKKLGVQSIHFTSDHQRRDKAPQTNQSPATRFTSITRFCSLDISGYKYTARSHHSVHMRWLDCSSSPPPPRTTGLSCLPPTLSTPHECSGDHNASSHDHTWPLKVGAKDKTCALSRSVLHRPGIEPGAGRII